VTPAAPPASILRERSGEHHPGKTISPPRIAGERVTWHRLMAGKNTMTIISGQAGTVCPLRQRPVRRPV
jgi:hypothetical protein